MPNYGSKAFGDAVGRGAVRAFSGATSGRGNTFANSLNAISNVDARAAAAELARARAEDLRRKAAGAAQLDDPELARRVALQFMGLDPTAGADPSMRTLVTGGGPGLHVQPDESTAIDKLIAPAAPELGVRTTVPQIGAGAELAAPSVDVRFEGGGGPALSPEQQTELNKVLGRMQLSRVLPGKTNLEQFERAQLVGPRLTAMEELLGQDEIPSERLQRVGTVATNKLEPRFKLGREGVLDVHSGAVQETEVSKALAGKLTAEGKSKEKGDVKGRTNELAYWMNRGHTLESAMQIIDRAYGRDDVTAAMEQVLKNDPGMANKPAQLEQATRNAMGVVGRIREKQPQRSAGYVEATKALRGAYAKRKSREDVQAVVDDLINRGLIKSRKELEEALRDAGVPE